MGIATQALVKVNNQVKREKEELLLKTKPQATMIRELQRRNEELLKVIRDLQKKADCSAKWEIDNKLLKLKAMSQTRSDHETWESQPQKVTFAWFPDGPQLSVFLSTKDKEPRTYYNGLAQLYTWSPEDMSQSSTANNFTALRVTSIVPMDKDKIQGSTTLELKPVDTYSVETPRLKNGELPNRDKSSDLKNKLNEIFGKKTSNGKSRNRPTKWNDITLQSTQSGETKIVSLCVEDTDETQFITMCRRSKPVGVHC